MIAAANFNTTFNAKNFRCLEWEFWSCFQDLSKFMSDCAPLHSNERAAWCSLNHLCLLCLLTISHPLFSLNYPLINTLVLSCISTTFSCTPYVSLAYSIVCLFISIVLLSSSLLLVQFVSCSNIKSSRWYVVSWYYGCLDLGFVVF